MSSNGDAAQHSESSDGTLNAVEISDREDASTSPIHTHGQKGMGDKPDQGSSHGAAEYTEARQDMEATVYSKSHSTLSATDESYNNRCSSASSMTPALAPDVASTGERLECDWAACVEACKGRLNRMLLDCGMPSLPRQV